MLIIRVLDLETCGLPTGVEADPRVVEAATVDLVLAGMYGRDELLDAGGEAWQRGRMWSSLVNPGVGPIPVTAMAVHHITNDMVKDAPPLEVIVPEIFALQHEGASIVLAAHNARFERAVLDACGVRSSAPWICTYKCALAMWPQAPSHNVQALRYWLGLKLAEPQNAAPHRALGDAYVTAAVLRRMLREQAAVQSLIDASERPALLPRFRFGKHAMVPIEDVPTDYLSWVTGQADMDEDARHTAKVHLEKRREAARARSPV